MSTRSFLLNEQLSAYADANWPAETNVILDELRKETAEMVEGDMQISPDQGQLFQILIAATGARRALEIGVFTGYSSSVTALALPSDGRLIALDVSDEYTSIARKYWSKLGIDKKIDLRIAPALESLKELGNEGEKFDFVFIDADKPNYWNYFDKVVPLVRTNGLIAIDNVLWSGRVADQSNTEEQTEVIRDFNRRLSGDTRVKSVLMPIGDGVTLALKL